ncbi:MAG TPA: hypothetical protein VGK52_19180 [Polyangia bacterium]|jgi:hypothetical protein
MAPVGNPGALADGAEVMTSLEIPAGSTITIPAGAKIVAGPSVVITVRGVLSIASAAAHARIATTAAHPDQAHAWGGIVVESGGRLDADGLDLAGATTALAVNAGSLGARYDEGTITDANVPFQIAAGARLDTKHAAVVNAGAASGIAGELHASYLDYDTSVDVVGGLITTDPEAIFDATDSTFHGTASAGNDYIISYASSLVHVAYSTITDAHCAFHFNDVARFEIDHVTAGASSPTDPGAGVVYGAMLYGSGAGPNVISNSSFMGSAFDLDQQSTNGPLTISNTFAKGLVNLLPTSTWLPADVAKTPISDAKPR